MKAELSLPASGDRMHYFVYKILTLRGFFSFWEWKKWEREIFSVVRNFDAWHTNWKLVRSSSVKDEHYNVPERNRLNLANSQGFEKISPFMFSAVAAVDTDAAAPIFVCPYHSCLGWTQPISCSASVSWEAVEASPPQMHCASPAAAP